MNPPEMSDQFATAFRSKLIDYVEQETRPRRLRALFGAGAVVAALAVGGGFAAYAGGVLNPEASLPDDVELPITQDVYDSAYARFAACMLDGGASLIGENLVGAVWEFSYPAEALPVYEACYEDFAGIDFQWQIAHSYDSPTYIALRNCLKEKGVEPAADVEGVWRQVQDNNIDPLRCAQ